MLLVYLSKLIIMPAVKTKSVTKRASTARTISSTRTITSSVAKKIRGLVTQDWLYVSPKDNMWIVRKDGSERAMHVYRLKATALSAAKRIGNLSGTSHIIVYNTKGEISRIIE